MIEQTNDSFSLHGPKVFKRIILILAVLLLVVSLFYATLLKLAVLFPVFVSGVFLVTIQFHRISINRNELIVEKYGLISWLNLTNIYHLSSIENIEYTKGTPVARVIVNQSILRSSGHGPRSQADRLILNFKDGKQKFINRISSRKEFLSLCEFLHQKIT